MKNNNEPNSYYIIEDFKIPKLPPLSHEKLTSLINKYHAGDIDAGKKIIEHNYGLVVKACNLYVNEKRSKIDLFQEGCLGLMKAIDYYDPTMGYKFSTYAMIWIKAKMLYYIEGNSTIRSINHSDFQLLKKITNVENMLSKKYDREVTNKELAEELGISVEKIKYLLLLLKDEMSLEYSTYITYEDEDGYEYEYQDNLYEEIDNQEPSPEDNAFELIKREILLDIINDSKICRTARDKDIIMKLYGFKDGQTHSVRSLSEEYGVTYQAIDKSKKLVLERIRKRYWDVLKPYYDEI